MQFYDRLFSKQFCWQPKLDGLAFYSIYEEASWLERLFEESEVLEVVKGMNSEKAMGPMVLVWHSSKFVGCDQGRYF